MSFSTHQQVELFHLLFLRSLEGKLDKKLYALKGGCNLRFFLKSIRYSEDIDFDVRVIAKDTLKKKVNDILGSRPLRNLLQAKGLEIANYSDAKQTETTQRWKLQLKVAGLGLPLPSRIEFSRRGLKDTAEFGPIEPELIQTYQLYRIFCSHYSKDIACRQKLGALVGRSETQSRDIFDLHHLFEQGATPGPITAALRGSLEQGASSIHRIDFETFQSQVVAYLSPEFQASYGSSQAWETIQGKVLQKIVDLL